MKQVPVFLLFALLSFSSFAQNVSIQGKILDEDGASLPAITLSLEGTTNATATDVDGFYFIRNVPPGFYVLVASGVGYSARSQSITVSGNAAVIANFRLNRLSRSLEAVVINAKQRRITSSSSVITRTGTSLQDLPQHIEVLDQATIREQQLFTVDQALKNVAGVNIATNYGAVNMRALPPRPPHFSPTA